jgi:hypothetical protein
MAGRNPQTGCLAMSQQYRRSGAAAFLTTAAGLASDKTGARVGGRLSYAVAEMSAWRAAVAEIGGKR